MRAGDRTPCPPAAWARGTGTTTSRPRRRRPGLPARSGGSWFLTFHERERRDARAGDDKDGPRGIEEVRGQRLAVPGLVGHEGVVLVLRSLGRAVREQRQQPGDDAAPDEQRAGADGGAT